MIAATDTPAVNPDLVATPLGDGMVMMNIVDGRYFTLDDIGADIWNRLDGATSVESLVRDLAAEYDADHARILASTTTLLDELLDNNLISI